MCTLILFSACVCVCTCNFAWLACPYAVILSCVHAVDVHGTNSVWVSVHVGIPQFYMLESSLGLLTWPSSPDFKCTYIHSHTNAYTHMHTLHTQHTHVHGAESPYFLIGPLPSPTPPPCTWVSIASMFNYSHLWCYSTTPLKYTSGVGAMDAIPGKVLPLSILPQLIIIVVC